MASWQNKNVLVVGLAKSGLAAAKMLLKLGAQVAITEGCDTAEIRQRQESLDHEKKLRFEIGQHTEAFCEGNEAVVVSPGVPATAIPIRWAQAKGIPIVSELELASQFCQAPLIAVTGSNGKTTTTSLIVELLRAGGKKARACGNIGTPLCDVLLEGKKWDFLVVEASSFQLERTQAFRPQIAVLLNLTQNHLDRHETFEKYARAKLKVLERQEKCDWAVLRREDEKIIRHYGPKIKAKILEFSLRREEGALGAFISGELLQAFWGGKMFPIAPLSKIQLFGKHNLENILAAVNVTLICRVPPDAIGGGLAQFQGVEHRLEKVGSIDQVMFINDSKATSVGAVQCALESLRSVVWIAGGRDKGSDFSPLIPLVREKVRHAVWVGEAREKLSKTFSEVVPTSSASSLEEAVEKAFENTKAGDCVLLSPGCASFDMFLNYEQRGKCFKDAVNRLVSKSVAVPLT